MEQKLEYGGMYAMTGIKDYYDVRHKRRATAN